MKNVPRYLFALFALIFAAVCFGPVFASSATAAPVSSAVTNSDLVFRPLLAEVAPVVTVAPVSALTSLLSNGTLWMAAISAISTLVAIWKNQTGAAANAQLSTAQKINQSLILGIETAGQLPEAQAAVAKVKSIVQAKATEYGVQPLLHAAVQLFTEQAATASAAPASAAPTA